MKGHFEGPLPFLLNEAFMIFVVQLTEKQLNLIQKAADLALPCNNKIWIRKDWNKKNALFCWIYSAFLRKKCHFTHITGQSPFCFLSRSLCMKGQVTFLCWFIYLETYKSAEIVGQMMYPEQLATPKIDVSGWASCWYLGFWWCFFASFLPLCFSPSFSCFLQFLAFLPVNLSMSVGISIKLPWFKYCSLSFILLDIGENKHRESDSPYSNQFMRQLYRHHCRYFWSTPLG